MNIPVAVIHDRRFNSTVRGEEVLVGTSVDAAAGTARWFPAGSGTEACSRVIDAFLDLWHEHKGTGLVLYISNTTVRRLLEEQLDAFPGLALRAIVTGPELTVTWHVCRAAFSAAEELRAAEEQEPEPEAGTLVIATDASKDHRSRVTGLGAVTSDGRVRLRATRTNSVLGGEFAAIAMALGELNIREGSTVEILTDSLIACRHLSGIESAELRVDSVHLQQCLHYLRQLEWKDVTVSVGWVRGHNGHPLNELADRAAVAARRCAQWQTNSLDEIRCRIRGELREHLGLPSGAAVAI